VAALIDQRELYAFVGFVLDRPENEDNFTLSPKLQQGFRTRVHIGLCHERHEAEKLLDLAFRLNSPDPEGHVPVHSEQGQRECAVRVSYISAPDRSERFSGLPSFPWISPWS